MANAQQDTDDGATHGSHDSGGPQLIRRHMRLAVQATGMLVGLGSGLIWTSWTVAKCAAVVALALGIFQIVNSGLRIGLGHWRSSALRGLLVRELSIGGGAMFALAIGGLLAPPSLVVLLCMSAVLAAAALMYGFVEHAVWDAIEAEGLEHCTSFLARQHPFRLLGWAGSLKEWSDEPGRGPIQACISRLLERPTVGKLSTTRSYIAALMAAMALLTATCAAGVAVYPLVGYHRHADAPTGHTAPTHTAPTVAPPAKPVPAPRSRSDRRAVADTWEARCDWLPGARPEDVERLTAPERATLRQLYLGGLGAGVDDPPGATAGCTGRAHISRPSDTRFVYVIGRDRAGRILSVATVSRQFGPAIFVGAAAAAALDLIERFRDIGGTRRMNAGSGQLYGVATPLGTAVLVRATIWSAGDASREEPFVTLAPPAATLWLTTMREFGVWLWPLPRSARDRTSRLRLVANLASGRQLAEIVVRPLTRTASILGQRSVTGPFGYVIGAAELASWAARAP